MDPEEIEDRQFLVTLRGYARDEVEAFREEVAQELRLLRKQLTKATAELSQSHRELERLRGEVAQLREDLAAERSKPKPEPAPESEDRASIFKRIGQETERILLAAEQAAEQMHERAVKESAEMLADARARVQRSMEELEAARRAAEEDFAEITDTRGMVASQLEDIGRRLEETINRLRVPVELPGPKSARSRQLQQSLAAERLVAGGNALKDAENAAQKRRQRELEAARELAARQTAHLAQARLREEEIKAAQAEAERRARAEAERKAREPETSALRSEQQARAAAAAADAERLKAAREADQRRQDEAERQAAQEAERVRRAAEEAVRAEAERSRRAAEEAAQAEAERQARLEAEAAAKAEAERVARAEAEREAQQEADRASRKQAEPSSRSGPARSKEGAEGAAAVAGTRPLQPAPAANRATAPSQTEQEKASSLDALLEEIRRKREEASSGPAPAQPASAEPAEDEIAKRNEALGDLPAQTARRLKRLLQEDHNDLLDRLRKQRGRGSLEENIAPADEQVARFTGGLRDALGRAFSEGRRAAGARSPGNPDAALQRLVGRQVVNPLRAEVSKAVSAGLEAEDSASALSERVNDVFRVWKGVRTQLLGEGIAHSAYHQGLLDALGSIADASKTWVLATDEQDCPNDVCRRNAEVGPVPLRSSFPSGHSAPPAHGGCTCTLKGS